MEQLWRKSDPATTDQNASNADTLMQSLASMLEAREYPEAARIFLGNRWALPADDGLIEFLTEKLTPHLAARLVSALSHFACPGCHSGLERCPHCQGSGLRRNGELCDACIGAGTVRCDMCGGSGLSAYNVFPAPLWYPVLGRRLQVVVRQAKAMVDAPVPAEPLAMMQKIVSLNKLMAALENALLAGREIEQSDPDLADSIQQMNQTVLETAKQLEMIIRDRLRLIASAIAADPTLSPDLAERRASYFRRVADSPVFERTSLYHAALMD